MADDRLEKLAEKLEQPLVIQTPGFDARFPNTNQSKNCWQNFVDFQKCVKFKGEDYPACKYFKRTYESLCPNFWVEKWQDQLENGVFPGLKERKPPH